MHAETNGISIQYELQGPPSAPAVVFSHSLGASLEIWRSQLEAFQENYRILLYDTRGHGGTQTGNLPITIETLSRDLLGLLDALAIDRAHFCGLSMGGLIGQWLGIHAPQRLQSLTLANTALKIGAAESWNTRIATVEREGMAAIIPGTLERWLTADFRVAHPGTAAAIETTLRNTGPIGYTACCAVVRDADFRQTASQISLPTLVIAGLHDPTTTPADLQALAAAIPNSKYVELEAGHISSVNASPSFNTALNAFLDSFS